MADPQWDNKGNIVIDPATSAPIAGTDYVNVGSGIDPWSTGITSELKCKHFNFSFLIDGKFGAKYFQAPTGMGISMVFQN